MKRAIGGLIMATCLALGCGPKARTKIPDNPGRVDAPYVLESDDDLDLIRARYDALADRDEKRRSRRAELAEEYARRIDKNIETGDLDIAFLRFKDLLSLWTAAEFSASEFSAHDSGLAVFAPQAQALRERFSRSGADIEAVATLAALALMRPDEASSYEQEIDEIFTYGDELAVAKDGPGAQRARPIEILERTVEFLPTQSMIDRLVVLYRERQVAINSSFRRDGADFELLRVHGAGALTSVRNIVRVLAQHGRLADALPAISDLTGIGDDAEMRKNVRAALSSTDSMPWVRLSAMFLERSEDAKAALALCQEAIRRYPQDALAHIAAGTAAREIGNVPLAIRYLERGLAIDGDHLEASETLATLYEAQVSVLAYSDRPNAALSALRKFETFHAQASALFEKPLEPDLASAYAAMARGLVSLGDLDATREYLGRSLELRPNLEALEYLGTMSLRQEHYQEARGYFAQAFELPVKDFSDEFSRIRLKRLAAEATAGLGERDAALKEFEDIVSSWKSVLAEYELPAATQAEALIEMGKVEFELGRQDEAVEHFFHALSKTRNDNSNHADLVAFLLNRGAFEHARDVYLDALGSEVTGEYYRIYMSLWILAESRKLLPEPDQRALTFLEKRHGGLWSHELARYAAGRGDLERLEKMATTRGRRAELLYYRAVIGPESGNPQQARRLLEEVVRGSMVLFFEYDMAKRCLRELP